MNTIIYNIRFCSEKALGRKKKRDGNHIETKSNTFFHFVDL